MRMKRTSKTVKRSNRSRIRTEKPRRSKTSSRWSTLSVTPTAAPTAPTLTPPQARTHRSTASPAQRRGADLVRYLRIHLKHPYGKRGEEAIRRLAVEVAHLGNAELRGGNEASVD